MDSSWGSKYNMSPDCFRCQMVSLVVTGIRPLRIQWLNKRDLLIKYASDANMPQLRDHLLQMDHWLAYPCVISCPIYDEIWVAEQSPCQFAPRIEGAEYIAYPSRVPLAHTNRVGWIQSGNWQHGFESLLQDLQNLGGCRPLGTPQFGNFSSDIPMIKGDVSYNQWIYNVKVSSTHYSDSALKEGMICSLRWSATETVRHLCATVDEIISKMTKGYGNVATYDCLMQEFYGLCQQKGSM